MRRAARVWAAAMLAAGAAEAAPPLAPFRDVNEVNAIARDGERIRFETPNGNLVFDPRRESWTVQVNDRPGKPHERVPGQIPGFDQHAPQASGALPAWYDLDTYGWVTPVQDEKSGAWLLVSRASEGASSSGDDVVDVARRTVYSLPPQDSRALLVTAEDIWIGHARGVTRIRRSNARRTDYVALPSVRQISGWVEHAGVRYVAAPEGALLALRSSGEIALIELPEEQLRTHDAAWDFGLAGHWSPDDRWRLTNPVLHAGRLHVGAFATDREGSWGSSESFLLSRDLGDGRWSVRLLPRGMRVRHLLAREGRLWLLGSMVFWSEGAESTEYGGIAVLEPDGRIISLQHCGGIPVVSWREDQREDDLYDERTIAFLGASGWDPAPRYSECRVETGPQHRWSSRWSPLGSQEDVQRYPKREFELAPDEQEALALKWRVRPRVVERNDQSLEVVRHAERTTDPE